MRTKVDLKTKKAKVIHEKRNKKTRRNKSMVKTKIIKELKCEFCGKGLRQEVNTWVVGGKEICIKRIPERCNCKQAKEYWKEQDEFERIKLLTKLEIERKKNMERLYTLSGMSSRLRNYNFENYKVCNENKTAYFKAKKYVADLLAGNKSNSLFITGNIGTGKTHLAASIANELIKNGQPVIFGTLINLLTEVKDSYSIDGEYESKIINKYSKIGLLIIDDLGKERHRQTKEFHPTNFTSNSNESHHKLIPDPERRNTLRLFHRRLSELKRYGKHLKSLTG